MDAGWPAFAAQVARLALWLAILAAVFLPLERWLALRRHPGAARWRAQDIFYYFANSLLPMLVLAPPLALVAELARAVLPAALPAGIAGLPLWASLLLALVVSDFGAYWAHRLAHRWPLLWRFHAVHHSPEHLYFLVNTRAHPVDLLFVRLCGLLPLYVLGLAGPSAAGSAAPLAVVLVGSLWGFFIHSNIRLRLGALEWLLSTPAFHHWHHSRHDHVDHNYAAMLPLLDRLFGTYYLPSAWPAQYGSDTAVAPTLARQLADPLLDGVPRGTQDKSAP
ncbi:MAG: fatty acid hydroxylase superfamily protein [Pseudoduganella sp.]|jgi:sterol desaturase/sphingolipid hydroxylase (fatty acid hydroxylase superfamily)|nr:fatty acid hydroxylase superfamily protein [Pseudoduganella sp.]